MSKNPVYDVVVVGNGVLGLSLALTLVRRKLRVALVGESHRPWAASTAAGAMLGSFGEVTSTLLKSKYGRLKHDLAVRATGLWNDWLNELEDNLSVSDIRAADGTFVIHNTIGYSKIDDDNFEAIRESLKEYGEPFEDMNPSDIHWLDPESGSRPIKAVYIPNEHAVNTARLLRKLEESFISHGGTLISEAGVRIERNNGRVEALVLHSGERLISDHIVIAAGVKSQTLLDTVPDVAARIPRLVSGYGVSALVSTMDGTTPNSVIRTPNRAFACGLHILPRSRGEVYVGATNIISPRAVDSPMLEDVVFLLECAYRQVRRDLSKGRVSRLQVGNRPVSLDGFPLIGETDLSGLWMMTGTFRDGLTLSPYLSREMAKLICGEPADWDLELFKPVRQPIQPFSREEVISETVAHTLATGYESGWRIPVGWHNQIEYNLRTEYEKFANDLDSVYTPPSNLLDASSKDLIVLKMLSKYYMAAKQN